MEPQAVPQTSGNEFISFADINVKFPFTPYECQKDFISGVIEALEKGKNAILESPTGTGKTACLLASSLAWLETRYGFGTRAYTSAPEVDDNEMASTPSAEGKFPNHSKPLHEVPASQKAEANEDGKSKETGGRGIRPQIFYATRTHSQIAQVIKELNRLNYHPQICVLGSRDHFCVNPAVTHLSSGMKSSVCRKLLSKKECSYFRSVEKVEGAFREKMNTIPDIEEVVEFGREHASCPYYLTRTGLDRADIVFLPYNYIVDSFTREVQKINISDSIIIFDEGHNLESTCTETSSFDLSTVELANFCGDLEQIAKEIENGAVVEVHVQGGRSGIMKEALRPHDFRKFKRKINSVIKLINDTDLNNSESRVFSGDYMYELFDGAEITTDSVDDILSMLEAGIGVMGSMHSRPMNLSKLATIIRTLFRSVTKEEGVKPTFKVNLREIPDNDNKKQSYRSKPKIPVREIGFWCFNSSVAMRKIVQETRSVIVASGTLTPMHSFAWELGVNFDVILENPHVVDPSHVLIAVLNKGPNGHKLSSSFENRSNLDYINDLGNAITNFVRIVPDGVLVFFPSYGILDKCVETWKKRQHNANESIWERIGKIKEPIVEPRAKGEFDEAMDTYYRQLKNPYKKGAIFFAVCRGKISEGIDFSDYRGRSVIICGIPYPAAMDPKVKLKKQYLDDLCTLSKGRKNGMDTLQGYEWYRQQAARAVNQALGRVIRHRNDYGAILLCDERFGTAASINQMPMWLRSQIIKIDKYPQLHMILGRFFKNMIATVPPELSRTAHDGLSDKAIAQAKMGTNVGITVARRPHSSQVLATDAGSQGIAEVDVDSMVEDESNVRQELQQEALERFQNSQLGMANSRFDTRGTMKYIVNNGPGNKSGGNNAGANYQFQFNNGQHTKSAGGPQRKKLQTEVQSILQKSGVFSPYDMPKRNNISGGASSRPPSHSGPTMYSTGSQGSNAPDKDFLQRRKEEYGRSKSLGHAGSDVIRHREAMARNFQRNATRAKGHALGVARSADQVYKPRLFAATGDALEKSEADKGKVVTMGSLVAKEAAEVQAKANEEIEREDRRVQEEIKRKRRLKDEGNVVGRTATSTIGGKTVKEVDADIQMLVKKYGVDQETEERQELAKKNAIVASRSKGWSALKKKTQS